MKLTVLIEPEYSRLWAAQIRTGIEAELSRKKYTVCYLPEDDWRNYPYDRLFGDDTPRTVIVIGTSPSWIPNVIAFFAERNIDVLLVSYQPPENIHVRGVVRIDYVAGIDTLLCHLSACGCRHTALYGAFPNSSTDLIKKAAYADSYPNYIASPSEKTPAAIRTYFDNRAGLNDCFERFFPKWQSFDSVLCVNDVAAVSLIRRLHEKGVRVPEDIQVVCFGNSTTARLIKPSLTTLSMSNEEVGRQTVSVFAYLAKADHSVSVSVRVRGNLTVGQSTLPKQDSRNITSVSAVTATASSFYDDSEVKSFSALENLLCVCDKSDLCMLSAILNGYTNEQTAEKLSLSLETVRYRIKRLCGCISVAGKSELIDFIKQNDFGNMITDGILQ